MQRIEEHLERFSLQDPLQSAYRQNHSTETAIKKLCNDGITSLDRGRCTVLASLDLSAAFDTVDHDILLQRLYTLHGKMVQFKNGSGHTYKQQTDKGMHSLMLF